MSPAEQLRTAGDALRRDTQWAPDTAMDVARWLESVAQSHEETPESVPRSELAAALAVARAYLGEVPS